MPRFRGAQLTCEMKQNALSPGIAFRNLPRRGFSDLRLGGRRRRRRRRTKADSPVRVGIYVARRPNYRKLSFAASFCLRLSARGSTLSTSPSVMRPTPLYQRTLERVLL